MHVIKWNLSGRVPWSPTCIFTYRPSKWSDWPNSFFYAKVWVMCLRALPLENLVAVRGFCSHHQLQVENLETPISWKRTKMVKYFKKSASIKPTYQRLSMISMISDRKKEIFTFEMGWLTPQTIVGRCHLSSFYCLPLQLETESFPKIKNQKVYRSSEIQLSG